MEDEGSVIRLEATRGLAELFDLSSAEVWQEDPGTAG
jgi:hypothetical protein